jgi:hypothetical protein
MANGLCDRGLRIADCGFRNKIRPRITADDTDLSDMKSVKSVSSVFIRGQFVFKSAIGNSQSEIPKSRPTRFLATRVGPSTITSNQTRKSHPIINPASRNTPKPVRSEPLLTTAILDLFDPPRQPKRPRAPDLGCSPPRRVD